MQPLTKTKQLLCDWLNDSSTAQLPKHVPSFDVMNAVASIAVVILHVNSAFWRFSYDGYWVVCNFIETLFYWAVPVFFMLSGATLIDYNKRYSTTAFIKRRATKTLIPFLFWSVFAILFSIAFNGMAIYGGSFSLIKTVDIIFNTKANSLYWFFIALFAVYLSVPLFAKVPEGSRKKVFTYIISAAILTYSIMPLACRTLNIGMNGSIGMPVAGGYVMYLLIGYCITRYPIGKGIRTFIYAMGAVGWLMHFAGTLLLSYKVGYISDTFKGYLNLPCVMFSVAIFVWFYYRKSEKNHKSAKLISALSSGGFGVYLVHYYIIYLFIDVGGIDCTAWYWLCFGTVAVYAISFALTLVIKKIPVIRAIVP